MKRAFLILVIVVFSCGAAWAGGGPIWDATDPYTVKVKRYVDLKTSSAVIGGPPWGDADVDDNITCSSYQPLDATLTDIADGTIAENLVNTTNPWADNEVANAQTITAQAGSTWNVADSVTALSVYTGTTSLEETTAANDSGAYIVGVFDEFGHSASANVQDVLDDLDAALRLESMVDFVKDSGADNTGASDASATLNTAITTLNASGGGTIWVPEGTYKLTSTIVPKSNVRIIGASRGGVIFDGDANPVLAQATGAIMTSFSLRNVTIQDVGNGNDSAVVIQLRAVTHSEFKNIHIKDYETGTGIYIPDPTDAFSYNTVFEDILMGTVDSAVSGIETGIRLDGVYPTPHRGHTHHTFRNIWIENPKDYGIRLSQATDHCRFYDITIRMNSLAPATCENCIEVELGNSTSFDGVFNNYFYNLVLTSDDDTMSNITGIKLYTVGSHWIWGLAQGSESWEGTFIDETASCFYHLEAEGHDCRVTAADGTKVLARRWTYGHSSVHIIPEGDYFEIYTAEGVQAIALGNDADGNSFLVTRAYEADDTAGLYLQTDEENAATNRLKLMATNADSYLDFTGDIQFRTIAGSEVATLTSAGALSVDGAITGTSCCADYVFEDGYELLTFEEVDKFVNQNKRLPGITFTQKDRLNFNLAVEELTVKAEEQALYILQLHERLKELEGRQLNETS